MQRVAIVGPSGSGKTTLGRWLERTLRLPFTDLDDVYWRPGWQPAAEDEFRSDVEQLIRQSQWAIAGNYSAARALIWGRADTLVWLDLPLRLVLWRTTRRVVKQWRSGELICNGNRQALTALLFGSDPLLVYTLRTHRQRERDWPPLLAASAHAHLRVARLRSDTAVARWQAGVQDGISEAT